MNNIYLTEPMKVCTETSGNVECFLPLNFIREDPAPTAEAQNMSPMTETVLSLLAELLLLLRTPFARFFRFFAVTGLTVLFTVVLASSAVSGQIGLVSLALRAAAVIAFGVLGTRRCL